MDERVEAIRKAFNELAITFRRAIEFRLEDIESELEEDGDYELLSREQVFWEQCQTDLDSAENMARRVSDD